MGDYVDYIDLEPPVWTPSTKESKVTENFSKAVGYKLRSENIIDLVLTLLFLLSTFTSTLIVLVEVFDMPLSWFTGVTENEPSTANQGGDTTMHEGSSSSSHRGSPGPRPDEGGDLPPGGARPQNFLRLFRRQADVNEQSMDTDRTVRLRGVLTRSSAVTKFPERFRSSSESSD